MKNYTAYFNRFTIDLPLDAVIDCSHRGDCTEDVEYWTPKIDIDASPEDIRAELKEYGAWDTEELADDEANKQRIVWSAACDIKEELARFPKEDWQDDVANGETEQGFEDWRQHKLSES